MHLSVADVEEIKAALEFFKGMFLSEGELCLPHQVNQGEIY